jgi:predicted ferric reductase
MSTTGNDDVDTGNVVSDEPSKHAKNSENNRDEYSETDEDLSNSSDSDTRALFQKARQLLCPTRFYRQVTYLYAERKLMVFFLVHLVSTLIVWSHFAIRKLDQQLNAVPETANRYWWKILTPSIEFGSMHAILFQMSLIPLTMARYTISSLCDSFINNILPLNRSLRMHIHLGYTMIIIVFLAVVFFFTFFGLLCSDGEEAFCEKFTEEIMITGYCILAFLLLVGFTSYFRHSIPYEIFYALHHVVFIMYFVTIAHTLDVEARTGKERSQTFKWFTSTLLFYFCDRAAMHLNHKYHTKVTAASTVAGTNGSRMIILKTKKPTLFQFKAGQYAFLRINEIDNHWHPFSIASGPNAEELEFYIEVHGERSWSMKLWSLLTDENGKLDTNIRKFVEVMGPYGTSLAKTEEYSHILSLGTGTGIVPILSLFKQHVRKMLSLDPNVYLDELVQREERLNKVQLEMEKRKGSIATKLGGTCRSKQGNFESKHDQLLASIRMRLSRHYGLFDLADIRTNMAGLRRRADKATRSLNGTVLLCLAPVFGVVVLGLTISWNTTEVDLKPGMFYALEVMTVLFQAIFAFASLCVWDSTSISNYVDLVFCLIAPFADWYWFIVYEMNGNKLGPEEVILASVFHGYMTLRLWSRAVSPRHKTWMKHVDVDVSSSNLNCLEMVWTTRSASQAAKILPDILSHYNALVTAWGEDNARKVCRVSINVTDPDKNACTLLENEFGSSGIKITYGRLEISRWIQDHTLRMIDCHKRSYSLLAFCGSPKFANEVHQSKIANDMIAAITGHKRHQMEYVSESYGGQRSNNKRIEEGAQTRPGDEQRQSGLNRRSEVRYGGSHKSFRDLKKLTFFKRSEDMWVNVG